VLALERIADSEAAASHYKLQQQAQAGQEATHARGVQAALLQVGAGDGRAGCGRAGCMQSLWGR